tara:strand:- start:62 stop:247 length:186 start_codon:yes stop_codon:yes gene_type:complete
VLHEQVLVLGVDVDVGGSGGQVVGLAQELRLTLLWESQCLSRTVLVHEGLRRREKEFFTWL